MYNTKQSYYETLEEALFHLRNAYSDILGFYAYEGNKGFNLIKKSNELVQQTCNQVVEELLSKDEVL